MDKATFRFRPRTRQAAHGPASMRRGLLCRPTWPRFGGDFFWPPRLARNPDNHAPVTAIRNKHEGAIGR